MSETQPGGVHGVLYSFHPDRRVTVNGQGTVALDVGHLRHDPVEAVVSSTITHILFHPLLARRGAFASDVSVAVFLADASGWRKQARTDANRAYPLSPAARSLGSSLDAVRELLQKEGNLELSTSLWRDREALHLKMSGDEIDLGGTHLTWEQITTFLMERTRDQSIVLSAPARTPESHAASPVRLRVIMSNDGACKQALHTTPSPSCNRKIVACVKDYRPIMT